MAKSCAQCRWCFIAKFGEQDHSFCRGAPPTALVSVTVNGDQTSTTLSAQYPPAPNTPCGAFKRRWFWEAMKAIS